MPDTSLVRFIDETFYGFTFCKEECFEESIEDLHVRLEKQFEFWFKIFFISSRFWLKQLKFYSKRFALKTFIAFDNQTLIEET